MIDNKELQHIAIIMDGNRRWATKQGKPKMLGHTEGAKNLKRIAKAVKKLGIKNLTVWALSTENLKRSEKELKHLFSLFSKLTDYLDDFFQEGVRCNIVGDISKLPEKVQHNLQEIVEKTKDNSEMTLTLAINYGGRDEIIRAIKKFVEGNESLPLLGGDHTSRSEWVEGVLTEEKFSKLLDTHDLPDPELIIRTGGHQRLSGFLPWQCTYSELYFTDTFWPAFDEAELDKAIEWYREQQRNRGK